MNHPRARRRVSAISVAVVLGAAAFVVPSAAAVVVPSAAPSVAAASSLVHTQVGVSSRVQLQPRPIQRQPQAVRPPGPTGCSHNRAAQAVLVSIARQHVWLCARRRLVRQAPITTGMAGPYTATPTGHYVIQGRVRNTTLTLLSGQTYAVRYWLPFESPLYGFHDASWQDFPLGSPLYRTRGSHGCIHMALRDIRFLYRWSSRPTVVRIA